MENAPTVQSEKHVSEPPTVQSEKHVSEPPTVQSEKHVSEPPTTTRLENCGPKKAPPPPVRCCEPCCTIQLYRSDLDLRCSYCNQRMCREHYVLANNPEHYGCAQFRGMCNFCNWDSIG